MPEQKPPTDLADELLAEWLRTRQDSDDARPPPGARLVDAYRSLIQAVLGDALRSDRLEHGIPRGPPDGFADMGGELEALLPRLAKAIRAERLTIAQVLEDLTALGPALVRALDARSDGVPPAALVAGFDNAMSIHTIRIVEMLEATSFRERREHEETLATMTEVLSHELKNRLGAARTAADVLLHPNLELDAGVVGRGAHIVRNSIDDALKTVDDVRALTTRQANLSEPRRRSIGLPGLVRALVEEARASALESNVEVSIDGPVPDVTVDAARVRLILVNLLQNGIKYRSESVEDPYVRVSATSAEGDRVVLRVADNGVGISPEELDDVFLPRFRGGVADEVAGSGLGLYIVEEAVEQVGGRITIDSVLGEGTTITVTFPVTTETRPKTD